MTRIAKLYARAVAGRTLSFAELCQMMEAFGYRRVRVSGSHHIYHNARIRDNRVVQPRGKDAKLYQVEQFLDMVKAFGLTMDD